MGSAEEINKETVEVISTRHQPVTKDQGDHHMQGGYQNEALNERIIQRDGMTRQKV